MAHDESRDEGKVYEIGFHVVPFVGDDNVAHEVGKVREALDRIKATVISEDFPRLRALAYPIAKAIKGEKKVCREAYFGWVKFEASPDAIDSLQKEVEKIENILRFLIVKTIRDNTLYGPKFAKEAREGAKKEGKEADAPKQEINEAELDKSIEELVVE